MYRLLDGTNIINIENLNRWIDENINVLNFESINRVLNIWMKENLNDIKLYNNILVNIIKKIIINFEKNIKEKHVDSELKDFIDYWLKKKNSNSFDFNLVQDFKNFLSKKYGTK